MEARLGVYEKAPYQPPGAVEGIDDQSAHLRAEGGHRQQERMIEAKRKSLDRALFNSYQAAEISPVGREKERIRALINANITKQDYDDKILSVGYEHNLKPGDVFQWLANGTHWLIYLQDLTELAYFRGDIRKCNYKAKWDLNGKVYETWMAIRGPVETKINFIQKNGISIDNPNHSLNILMPKTKETVEYFKRYSKFYIGDSDDATDVESVCWRVEATDQVSMPGILEINAVEYFSNEFTDDLEKGIANITPEKPEIIESLIEGPSSIKPKTSYIFNYLGDKEAKWIVDSKYPMDIKVHDKTVEVTWLKTFSGKFTISFGETSREIIVESLF